MSLTSCQGDDGSDVSFDEDAPGITFDYVSRLDCSLQFNDYCGQLNESYTTSIRNQETQTYPETVCSETQTEELNPVCKPTEVKTKDTHHRLSLMKNKLIQLGLKWIDLF